MVDVLNLYLDDSGTRHPDRKDTTPIRYDWFGLGGVMVLDDESGEDVVRARHGELTAKWKISSALHSAEIRNRSKNFRWLRGLSEDAAAEFYADVATLMTSPELTAIACVINRPGYNTRYHEQYGPARWYLCKTAFTVVVERAVKHARSQRKKLRVLVERSDRDTDQMLRGYYDALREKGHPFDPKNAAKYTPVSADEYRDTLYEFRKKDKQSPLMQVADLALWPMCIGGYDKRNGPYNILKNAGTLIDSKLTAAEIEERGIKYSCFD